jgi:hypothetical protein
VTRTIPVGRRVTLLIALLLPPLPEWAQPLDSFEKLALLITRKRPGDNERG